jgi:hypothetical protein
VDPKPPPCTTAAQFDPANSPNPPKVDNHWNPLAPGMQFVWAEEATQGKELLAHRVVSTVTDLTKVVNDVHAVVILESDINEGVLEKSKLAFQAQDNAGNLWNLGEVPAEFDHKGTLRERRTPGFQGYHMRSPATLCWATLSWECLSTSKVGRLISTSSIARRSTRCSRRHSGMDLTANPGLSSALLSRRDSA